MAIGGKATPRLIAQREKEARAIELRKQGYSYEAIAQHMGMANRTGARRLVMAAMTRITDEPAEELRKLECERLDAIYNEMWRLLESGESETPDRVAIACIKVIERRAKLLGLDAPARSRVEVITEDVIDAEIARLEAELARTPASAPGKAPPPS